MKRRKLTASERREIYDKCDNHCAYCGEYIKYEDMQVDHVMPLHKGGADSIDNMLPACRSCNHYKSTLTLEQFRANIERMPDVLTRDNTTYKIAARFGVIKVVRPKVTFYFEKWATFDRKQEVSNNG